MSLKTSPDDQCLYFNMYVLTKKKQKKLNREGRSDTYQTHVCSSMIILNRSDYLAEADHQLVDCSIYQPLSSDPTQSFNTELSSFVITASPSQGLSKDDISLLLNPQLRTHLFTSFLKSTNLIILAASFSSSIEHVSTYLYN